MEIWKDIINFEGLYQVSNKGNVKSLTRYKKKLTPHFDKDGYKYVKLKHKGKSTHARIARLVASAFIPTNDNSLQVNHIDFDRTNDNVENLEWVTAKQNVKHSKEHYVGSNHKPVLQIKDGIIINSFCSLSEAERKTGAKCSNIVRCCKGQRKTAKGFQWEYADSTEVTIE